MAVSDDESMFEGLQTSLLDIIEDRNRTLNKKCQIHRTVIISRIYQDFEGIGRYFEKFLHEAQNNHQTEPVSGLMLIYPKLLVHILESSLEVLLDLCADLKNQASQLDTAHISASKILVVSYDIPHKLFQNWNYKVLDIEAPNFSDVETQEQPESVVIEMQSQLLKLGGYLAKQPKTSLQSTMESLHDKVPELLPQQDLIEFLLESSETGCLATPEEFSDSYDRPYEVILSSELVWPLSVKLFPYN